MEREWLGCWTDLVLQQGRWARDADRMDKYCDRWRRTDCNGINKQTGVGILSASIILSFTVWSMHMIYVHLCMFTFVYEFVCTCAMWRSEGTFGWHMHASTHIHTCTQNKWNIIWFFFFFETVSYYVALTSLKCSRAGWSRTHRDPPVAASWMLRLKKGV